MIDASPAPGSDLFESCGGATVNVFTTTPDERDAISVACQKITEAGWRVNSIEETHWVTREDYTEDQTGIEYFDQAMIDGSVLVFHTYPPEIQDGDAVH